MPRAIDASLRKESRLLRNLSQKPTPEQVHDFRTTARRIEAVLEKVFDQPPKNERKLLKQLQRVRRRTGRVRDLDVQIANLQQLNLDRENECKSRVLQQLREKRSKALKRLLGTLDKRTTSRLRKRLRRAAEKLSPPQGPHRAAAHRKPNARALTARRLQKLQSKSPLAEQTLHPYRLQCKNLRYTLELSPDPDAVEIIEQLKSVQDAVGKWHDSTVLLESAQAAIDHTGTCPLVSALRNLAKAQLWQALQTTRNVVSGLTAYSTRKPVQRKTASTFTSAAATA